MIADHYLVKKSFGSMIVDEEKINGYGLLSITFDPASIGVVPNLFVFGIA